MCNVNKTEFEKAYKNFPPGKLEKFFLTNISPHGFNRKIGYVWLMIILLIIPLILELTILFFNLAPIYRIFPNIFYAILMASAGISWAAVMIQKQKRLNKIREYLCLNKEEFKQILDIYFHNRYSTCDDFITFNSTNIQ